MEKKNEYNQPIPEDTLKFTNVILNTLRTIFDEDVNNGKADLSVYMQYLPLFAAYGSLLAAQLNIKQDEYYAITDYYIKKMELIADENDEQQKEV